VNHPDRHGPLIRDAYQGPLLALRNYVAYANGSLPTTDELLACLALMQEEISRVTEQAERDVEEAAENAYDEGHADGSEAALITHQFHELEDQIRELEQQVQELGARVEELEVETVVLEGALRGEDAAIEREAIQTEHYLTAWDHILSDDPS
jgi:predicted RNase H-like nuclease (RuvC/YqgF family)